MATYHYVCIACNHEEDLSFPIGTAPREIEASDHILRLQIAAPSVHFPGTNFSRSSVGAKTR